MRTFSSLGVLAASWGVGCGFPEGEGQYLDSPLWDVYGTVVTDHGLYVPLTYSGGVAYVTPNGYAGIDVGEGRVTRVEATPDGSTAVAFVDRYVCSDPDAFEYPVELPDDCFEKLKTERQIALLRTGAVDALIPVPSAYNALEYADDGRFAIAYLGFDQGVQVTGVVNLTAVLVVDLITGETTTVTVGFAADRVLFVHDAEGEATSAVVLSQNSVAVVELTADDGPYKSIDFPLTLDPDQTVTPVGVELTPDGEHALITVSGRNDLYALDLVNPSVNIVTLAANPADMEVCDSVDRTVMVYSQASVFEVLSHDSFDLELYDLDEPMNAIIEGDGYALLYNTSTYYHDAYRFDFDTNELVEYRLENTVASMHLSPDGLFAIALTRPEGVAGGTGVSGTYDLSPGMEVIDLTGDDTTPFLLQGMGVGVAFTETKAGTETLVLQEGVEFLYRLAPTGEVAEVSLSRSPRSIGGLPDGTFYITHDSALGLISFYDPVSDEIVEIGGFGALGMSDPIELYTEEEG